MSVATGPSQRQLEMLCMHGRGMTYEAIATVSNISDRTVQWHMDELRETLGARNASHALVLAIGRGFICVDSRSGDPFVPVGFVDAA